MIFFENILPSFSHLFYVFSYLMSQQNFEAKMDTNLEESDLDSSVEIQQLTTIKQKGQSLRNNRCRRKSLAWSFYNIGFLDDGRKTASCQKCSAVYSSPSITNLNNHLRMKHPGVLKQDGRFYLPTIFILLLPLGIPK